jgi:GT2 family glycosyltransferase
MSGGPDLSVVISTRERPDALANCLAALEAQDGGPVLEAVVVDDGSPDGRAVAALVESSPVARLVRTAYKGVAHARNAGSEAARAPIVAFTDDDCVPEAGWAAALVGAFENGTVAAAGPTLSDSPNPFDRATQTVVNELAARAGADGARTFSPGSNLACRRELLAELPFRAQRYFRTPGEDRDWCARLVERGHRLKPVPAARVRHRQGLALRSFWHKHRRYGQGAYLVHTGVPRPARQAPGFYLAVVRKGFEDGLATGVLVILSQLATAVGFAEQALSGRVRAPQALDAEAGEEGRL